MVSESGFAGLKDEQDGQNWEEFLFVRRIYLVCKLPLKFVDLK
jgi:hypothetical protein